MAAGCFPDKEEVYMKFVVTAQEKQFRDEVRAWLTDNVPREKLPPITFDGAEHRAFLLAWQKCQHDAGWAGIDWPTQYGGRGLSIQEQVIWFEEYARAGGPHAGGLFPALKHAGPTLILRGSEAQKRFHLPRILQGEAVWCQGFSEPGAGSDLAGLRCRGTIDGDHIVVNGSKIWTSFAQFADYQELLVRTDADSVKHRGISWVICDMRTPGITIRQIKAIDGEYHNCEVFYDDVRIPLANVVGDVGAGWSVAMSTLSFERGTAFMQVQLEQARAVEELIRLAAERVGANGRPLIDDEALAERLARLRGEVAAARAMIYMTASRGLHQDSPGPEGTFVPLFFAELSQRVQAAAMDILGPDSLYYDVHDMETWSHKYLRSLANTILGGTSEIRRNIIGERVLGLPRDARN
jgi:alkylation response protein AidB-like acyl-CoA dehydrogenase